MKNISTKYPILFSLYIAQSIPMSFFSTVVPVIMRQGQYSLESIALLQLVKLPWIFKFLWAPFIDNHSRNTQQLKRWIIFSELFYALIILSIGFFDLQTDFKAIIFLLILAFAASATQDIATDIFAIFILKKRERSIGNSLQSAGSFVGSLVGTGLLLIAYYHYGWTTLLNILALCIAFAVVPIILYKNKLKIDKTAHKKVNILDIGGFFKKAHLRRRTLLLLFYYSGIIGILTMLKPYLVDLGFNAKEIGLMSGIIGTSTAIVFSLIAGYLIKYIGKTASFYLFLSINLLTVIIFLTLPQEPNLLQLYIAICILWGTYGMSSVIIYTTAMDYVRKDREGTDFTLQIVITHISSIFVAIISGKLGDLWGYKGVFRIELALIIVTFFVLLYVVPLKKQTVKKRIKQQLNS